MQRDHVCRLDECVKRGVARAEFTLFHRRQRVALRRLQAISSLHNADEQVDYLSADWDFHSALVALSDNRVLQGMYDGLRPNHERVGMTARPTAADLEILDREHSALYDSLMNHDATAGQMWLSRHLDTIGPRGEIISRI
ncbi:FCD domain-containing protein [Acetobacter nitrogenifigens]|uniref:FCD domain-containing protein n=1 Tax=Acetobacter nitrogenifigens TaxID=285268 RepID=UPI000A013B2A|nr:FCD domain-containing protein [Acetobacter nitrogenifigens]